jgi:hypothetical protein
MSTQCSNNVEIFILAYMCPICCLLLQPLPTSVLAAASLKIQVSALSTFCPPSPRLSLMSWSFCSRYTLVLPVLPFGSQLMCHVVPWAFPDQPRSPSELEWAASFPLSGPVLCLQSLSITCRALSTNLCLPAGGIAFEGWASFVSRRPGTD